MYIFIEIGEVVLYSCFINCPNWTKNSCFFGDSGLACNFDVVICYSMFFSGVWSHCLLSLLNNLGNWNTLNGRVSKTRYYFSLFLDGSLLCSYIMQVSICSAMIIAWLTYSSIVVVFAETKSNVCLGYWVLGRRFLGFDCLIDSSPQPEEHWWSSGDQ